MWTERARLVSVLLTIIYALTPVCSQTDVPLRYHIVEELAPGTDIADLMIDAGFKRRYYPVAR